MTESKVATSENEKLRTLLAEARDLCVYDVGYDERRELKNKIDAALAEPVESVKTALNHPANCSIYDDDDDDDGRCTCGKAASDSAPARTPLAPGEGTWSVFAERVVRERDEARAEVERLRRDWGGPAIRLGTSQQTANEAAREGFAEGFRRGAEAMRGAAIAWLMQSYADREAESIRDLPVPEDK